MAKIPNSAGSDGNYINKPENEQKDSKKLPPVSFFQLFRFATSAEKAMLIFGCFCSALTGLITPGSTFFFSKLTAAFLDYSTLVQSQPLETANAYLNHEAKKYCLILVGFSVGMFFTAYLQIYLFSVVSERQIVRIREIYYKSVIRQNMGWFDEISSGDLTSRISSDVSLIQDGIGVKLGYLIQYLSLFVGAVIITIIRGYKLALVAISIIPFLTLSALLMGSNVGKQVGIIQNQYAKSSSITNEVVSGMRTVMAFNGQKHELERFSDSNRKAAIFERKKGIVLGLGLGSITFFSYVLYSLGLWYGAKLIRQGAYDPVEVITIFFIWSGGGFALAGAAPNITAVISARGAASSVFDVIDRMSPIDPLDTESGIMAENIKGEIELKNVTFSYPSRPEVPALSNFSIKINPGEKVALVGESGCGKSTIIALIQRFYDPQEGSVLVDGIDVKDYNITSLRRNLAIVSQEPTLFDTTIHQNVSWGAKDYDNNPPANEKVIQACKDANIHEFIVSLPDQYDTLVGERGAQLSGGQKQRIAIARALIRNSPILLLDEATSALDTESERLVQDAIDKNIKNRTTITVAHRLSTIKDSHRIYVCGKGSIIEQGTHRELLAKLGAYAMLVNAQELHEVDSKKPYSECFIKSTKDYQTQDDLNSEKSNLSSKDKIDPPNAKLSDYNLLFRLLIHYRKEIYLYIFGAIGSILDGMIFPLFSIVLAKMLVSFSVSDPKLQKKETDKYALLLLVLGIIGSVSVFSRTVFFNFGSSRLSQKLKYDHFDAIISQEYAYFDKKENGTGAITARLVSESENVYKFGSEAMPMLLSSLSSLITGVTIAFTRDWKLTFIILATIPLLVFSESQNFKFLSGRAVQNQIVIEAGAKEAAETVANIRTVASLTRESTFVNSFNSNNATPYKNAIRYAFTGAASYGFAQSLMIFIYCLSFYVGSRFVLNGNTNVENTFNAVYAIIFSTAALGQASQFLSSVPKAVVSSMNLTNEFNVSPNISIKREDGHSPSKRDGRVSTENVEFTYPSRPNSKILKSINLNALIGKTVALVGSSGSGKSTMVNLIMRLYDVELGSIKVEETDVREWNLKELRDYPSLVSQEPVLFDCSISANIKYGKPDATAYEIEQAAKAANIHDVLLNLPDGYDTRVGANGAQLSGGQKQRIAIARAIISNPKILLLDEATSALDAESENIVQKALNKAASGRTTITIAHRLSTIQSADWIYVFDRGGIAEEGTHQLLTERKGIYYNLAVQQSLSE